MLLIHLKGELIMKKFNEFCHPELCKVQHDKFGFTLAEVLITLGIIGVVAAITIPNMITNYQKRQTVTKLKKVYAELNQALKLSEVENDYPSSWDVEGKTHAEAFEQYIARYMKIINKQEYDKLSVKRLSGEPETKLAVVKANGIAFTTINGTQIYVRNDAKVQAGKSIGSFLVDINGPARPNQFGKDIFQLYMPVTHPEYGIYLYGQYSISGCTFPKLPNKDRNILISGSDDSCKTYACNKNARGVWCGALIMADGWEIRSDYPW